MFSDKNLSLKNWWRALTILSPCSVRLELKQGSESQSRHWHRRDVTHENGCKTSSKQRVRLSIFNRRIRLADWSARRISNLLIPTAIPRLPNLVSHPNSAEVGQLSIRQYSLLRACSPWRNKCHLHVNRLHLITLTSSKTLITLTRNAQILHFATAYIQTNVLHDALASVNASCCGLFKTSAFRLHNVKLQVTGGYLPVFRVRSYIRSSGIWGGRITTRTGFVPGTLVSPANFQSNNSSAVISHPVIRSCVVSILTVTLNELTKNVFHSAHDISVLHVVADLYSHSYFTIHIFPYTLRCYLHSRT